MKKVFLKAAILPVLAFVLASAGAVSTSDSNSSSTTLNTPGWKRISPIECEYVADCNNEGSVICMSGSDQLFGKPTPASFCEDVLTHRP